MLKEYRKTILRPGVFALISLLSLVIIIFSCERLEIKRIIKVKTGSVSGITATSSIVQGNVIEKGEGGIKQHGHCWSETSNPTITIHKTDLGARNTTGTFNSTLVELSPNTQYFVRAYATDNEGTTYGNEISFVTEAIPIPEAPGNLAADAESSSQITISWTDNSNNEEGFKIERSPDGSTNWVDIAAVGSNITNFSNIGLSPSTQYCYRVRAFNAGGNSGPSNINCTTTQSDVPVPATPTNLIADANFSSQIDLSWTNNADNEEGFKIERSPDGSTGWVEIAVVGAGVTNFQNTNLNPSTPYYYRVRAYNPGGNSDYSNIANATTLSNVPVPAAPTNLFAEAISDSRIDLSWTDNSDNEEGFHIERSEEGINWIVIATVGADVTIFQNTELAPSTPFYYRVRAFNPGGDSEPSDTTYAKTFLCPGTLIIDHIAGDVAPVTETNFRYGVVETNLTGENKCWLKQNLGAHRVAGGPTDDTEESAGWYWQFNRKQGYQHDGITRTPGTTWIYPIDEVSEWQEANDPCAILFGRGWRIPTQLEWENADRNGGWNNYNDAYASDLKLHAAGELMNGSLYYRGSHSIYWSSTQNNNTSVWCLALYGNYSQISSYGKSYGSSVRCLKD